MVILHATTTTKVKIDHTKRPLLTHTPPPEPPQKHHQFLGGGEGVINSPLPHHKRKNEALKKCLLFEWCKMYQGTKTEKQNKYY